MSDFPSPLHLSLLTPDMSGATGATCRDGASGATGQAGAAGTIYFNDLNIIHLYYNLP